MLANLAAALLLLIVPLSSHAATEVLTAIADAYVIPSVPDNNTGGHTHVASGASGTLDRRRGLFRFDLTSIPAGSTVTSASLEIDVVGLPAFGSADSDFDVFRLSRGWGEGDKTGTNGQAASAAEVTWNSAEHAVTAWTTAGGDFDAASSGTTFVSGIGSYTFSSAKLAADVQLMLDAPAGNFGWLLRTALEGTARTARRFGSREGSAAARLTVEFDPPAAPVPSLPGLALGALALGLLSALQRLNAMRS